MWSKLAYQRFVYQHVTFYEPHLYDYIKYMVVLYVAYPLFIYVIIYSAESFVWQL